MRSDFCKKVAANDMPSAATCLSHMKKILSVFQRRVEPSHPRKRLVASRSVASAFTSEQQRHSATFFGEETQQNERAGDFYKKSRRKRYEACGDVVEAGRIELPSAGEFLQPSTGVAIILTFPWPHA